MTRSVRNICRRL